MKVVGYIVFVPALPGCFAQGETIEEALEMTKDAIEGYLLTLKEINKEILREKYETIVTKVKVSI